MKTLALAVAAIRPRGGPGTVSDLARPGEGAAIIREGLKKPTPALPE